MKRLGTTANSWGVSSDLVSLLRKRGDASLVTFPAAPQGIELDLRRSALIVIDMQNDFCARGGWLDSIGVDISPTQAIIPLIRETSTTLRTLSVPIIWLNWGNRPDQANLPPGVLHVYNPTGGGVGIGDPLAVNGSRVLEVESWSASPVEGLDPSPGDLFVDKYRMSGFYDTALDSILRNLDVTTLLFAGVNVDQCVLATLMDAAALGYDVVLLKDCCASTSPSYCIQATEYNVAQCFGFVASAADLNTAIINGPLEGN